MTGYAAFLRGVNLGPTRKISMPELRGVATELRYSDVRSHLNSGNLVFGSGLAEALVEQQLASAIEAKFGHRVDVAVRTARQLATLLEGNPYPDGNPSHVTVAFLTGAAGATAKQRVAAVATDGEPFTFAGREVWVNYTEGIGNSKLAARFSAIVGVSATVRNVRTVAKVAELATGVA